ncbi:hypothetical protein VTO73DRAFT_3988 [Trametes versicolor]
MGTTPGAFPCPCPARPQAHSTCPRQRHTKGRHHSPREHATARTCPQTSSPPSVLATASQRRRRGAPYEPGCAADDESGPCGGRRGAGAPRRAPARVHSPTELEPVSAPGAAVSALSCAFPSAHTGNDVVGCQGHESYGGQLGARSAGSGALRRQSPCARVDPRAPVASRRGCVATSPAAASRSSTLDRASTLAFANTTTGLQVRGNRTRLAASDAVVLPRAREMRRRELWFQGEVQPFNNAPTPRAITTLSTGTRECHDAVGTRENLSMVQRDDGESCAGSAECPASRLPVASRRRSTSGTAMHGTAAPTPDLPLRIIRRQSGAHRGYAVGHLAYGTSLVTGRQDGWLGLVPPPSPVLSLCRGDGVRKLT